MTSNTPRKTMTRLVLAGCAAAVLSACATPFTDTLPPMHMRNPIQVAESIERLELYTRPTGLELSARDKLAVAQFLDGYRADGTGPLFMNQPSTAAQGLGTQQAETVIRGLMAQGGMNPTALQLGSYQSAQGAPAPVVVSYRTLQAIPQDCRAMEDIVQTYNNQPHRSFGCFHSANLAALVTDPRQLLEPYAQGAPNSQRRTVVYDKYIAGENTAAQIPTGQRQNTND